ncbi:MAG: nucleotidyltransferase family protein [bacterium]|nr:nucleotidyltransferase family protein [bacterium]
MRAIILAGGEGTRLRPITYEIPKPLIPVKKQPILSHLVSLLRKHNIDDIGVLIGKNHEEDYERWKEHAPHNAEIFIEPIPQGTFGWIRNLKDWIGDESFAVINGDTLLDIDITEICKTHTRHNPVATLALIHTDDAKSRGMVKLENEYITEFAYKKGENDPGLISAGFVIFKPSVFDHVDRGEEIISIENDVLPKLAGLRELVGHVCVGGRCYDCGTLERWEKAIKEW